MSRRDRFRTRGRPSASYLLPVDDMAAAARAVRLAGERLNVTYLRRDEDAAQAVEQARQGLDQAQEQLEACYEPLVLTALAPDDFELLIAEHPPREGTSDEKYNPETFPTACFLACAPADLPEAEWRAFLTSNVSLLERDELLELAVAVNVRKIDGALPKG